MYNTFADVQGDEMSVMSHMLSVTKWHEQFSNKYLYIMLAMRRSVRLVTEVITMYWQPLVPSTEMHINVVHLGRNSDELGLVHHEPPEDGAHPYITCYINVATLPFSLSL